MDDSPRICPHCDCRLCYDTAAYAVAPGEWLVVVQCPNCWKARSVHMVDAVLQLFEQSIDDDLRVILDELEQLEQENAIAEAVELEERIDRFVTALEVGAILPMDF
jgi:hypothetical protein